MIQKIRRNPFMGVFVPNQNLENGILDVAGLNIT